MSRTAAGRWELLRALGAVPDSPAAARGVGPALGLDPVSDAGHTDAFVLNCPPYAAIYLGPEGAIGGEGADRVAGFWRAIGITPPAGPDHLTALLGLYARLGEAAAGARRPATAAALAQSQAVLFWEHLWPWLPAYLDAVPLDPFDGQVLRYRRVEDGVVIYSISSDEIDNNGNFDRERSNQPGVDIGCRLWDVAKRRQPARPKPPMCM